MSLILAYHNPDFGVVCTDGRVSRRLFDGRAVAVSGKVGKKFAVLRHDLILAGSSSWSAQFDLLFLGRMQELVEVNPSLSFTEIASAIPAIVASAGTSIPIPPKATTSVILLGYDTEERRVRNVAFAFNGEECKRSEHDSGAVAAGFIEPQEGIGQKILEGMGDERTIESARRRDAHDCRAPRGRPFACDRRAVFFPRH